MSKLDDFLQISEEELDRIVENNVEKKSNEVINGLVNCEAPVTSIQERIWYTQKTNHLDRTYNLSRYIYANSGFCLKTFMNSLRYVISINSILRTVFYTRDGEIIQKIISNEDFEPFIECIDYSDSSKYNREDKIKSIIDEVVNYPYSLESGPLFIIKIVLTGADSAKIFFGIHHIIIDGWSLNLVLDQVLKCYREGTANQNTNANYLQYKDYAIIESSRDLTNLDNRLNNIYERLKNVKYIKLPFEFSTVSPKKVGQRLIIPFDFGIIESINMTCSKFKISKFSLFASVFSLALYSYVQYEKIAITTTMSCRDSIECELLIGPIINTIVIDISIYKENTFLQLLERTNNNFIEIQEERDIPYDRIVAKLNPDRHNHESALEQFGLDILNYDLPREINNWECGDIYNNSTRLDIYFSVFFEKSNLLLDIQYNSNKYCSENIQELGRVFMMLLEKVINDVGIKIESLNKQIHSNDLASFQPSYIDNITNQKYNIEKNLLSIWCKILKHSNISVSDDFFDVGGHSLLLISIYDAVRENLCPDIEFIDVYNNTKISDLAEVILTKKSNTYNNSANVIENDSLRVRNIRGYFESVKKEIDNDEY